MMHDDPGKAKQPAPAPKRADDRPLDPVEEADEESFPASDAPGWIPMHPGPPKPKEGEPPR